MKFFNWDDLRDNYRWKTKFIFWVGAVVLIVNIFAGKNVLTLVESLIFVGAIVWLVRPQELARKWLGK